MPGHPDFDVNVVWQGTPLYVQTGGAFPAAGTVLFSGPVTNFPAIQVRQQATTGGVRVRFYWFLDAALTQQIGTDAFDSGNAQGVFAVYECEGPYLKIVIDQVTVAPAGAGILLIFPTRATALGFRPLVTPQVIALSAVTIPAGQTNTYIFRFVVLGRIRVLVNSVAPAGAISVTVQTINYDSTVNLIIQPATVATAPANYELNVNGEPLQVLVQNTTGAPATIDMSVISLSQGW